MEQSLSSVAFKGSIPEAIAEAKQQKKLFVVYISGDNPESRQLETSTWIHPNVSETLTKYCILLHILEGSSEESQFSAIYPQNSAPSITAIGYNGVQLWQTEGFIAADVLASSLEKAWLSLHVQETTAAFLTAALASGRQLASGTSETTSEQESPGTNESSPSLENHIPSPDVGLLSSNTIEERNSHEDAYKGTGSKRDDEALPEPSHANVLETAELGESTSTTNREESTWVGPVEIGQISHEELMCTVPGENIESQNETFQEIVDKAKGVAETNTDETKEVEKVNTDETKEIEKVNTDETKEVEKANADETKEIEKTNTDETEEVERASKSNDVFLHIRLPDGFSLQVKFSVMDTLRMVKDYTINNMTSSLGSFDLAIPYPRKVFSDQELDSTLSELSLFNRQALVVVPHKQTNSHHGGGSSSRPQTYSSNDDDVCSNGNGGYWASIKGILSYANPFSYFTGGAGSASATQQSGSGTGQYNPNTTGNLRSGGRASNDSSSDQSRSGSGRRNSKDSTSKQQTSRFGGNIHTLKHDEDEDPRHNDRNTYWNGNSTQFGGNDDEK